MRSNLLLGAVVLLQVSQATVLNKRVDPPTKLPGRATPNDLRYQPAIDFDTDSCYNVPAIGCDGRIAEGLPIDDLTTGCRDAADLDNTNVYSRQRCNNGMCAYMYDYYFEKDYASSIAGPAGGHRNDWEHITVFVPDDSSKEKWVCGSAHGGWNCRSAKNVRWHEGDHPKMVYHKDGASTHAWRFANEGDDAVENHKGTWQLGDLVSWEGFPTTALRDALVGHDFGSASFALKDSSFSGNLKDMTTLNCPANPRIPCEVTVPYKFDPDQDVGSPGTPPAGGGCGGGGGSGGGGSGGGGGGSVSSVRAMIMGDSITQGFEGDWTWRQRLDQWFASQGIQRTFVGPWVGTYQNKEPSDPSPPPLLGQNGPAAQDAPRTSGLYSRQQANSNLRHWALWGRQAAQAKSETRARVAEYSPDYLLVMLGFNDLGWFVSGPEGTLASIKTIVDEARAAKPNIKILIANVVHRTFLDGREDLVLNTDRYNAMLRDSTPTWASGTSPIAYVDVNSVYGCSPKAGCPAAYDGLHPGELGEYQIARAFSEAFVNIMRVGSSPLVVASPNDPNFSNGKSPVTPSALRVMQSPWGLKVEWERQFGANSWQVRSRMKGSGDWTYWPGENSIGVNRWDNSWVLDGQEWEYSVRTLMGSRRSDWSAAASNVAHPTNPQGPKNLRSVPTSNGIALSWDAVPGAILYEIIAYDQSATGIQYPNGKSFAGTSVTLTDGIVAGHKYGIAVITWVSTGPGFPAVGKTVVAGVTGNPAPPTNVQIRNVDATTVQLTWDAVPNAAGYKVYARNYKKNDPFVADDYAITATNSHGVGFLFPGTWNFQFYVVTMNGNLESIRSNIVVPPVYPGYGG